MSRDVTLEFKGQAGKCVLYEARKGLCGGQNRRSQDVLLMGQVRLLLAFVKRNRDTASRRDVIPKLVRRSVPLLDIGAQRRLPDFDYATSDSVFFVTVRARAETSPFTDRRVCAEVVECLEWLRRNERITLYAFCLMPDHIHLLLRLKGDGKTLGEVVGSFKSFTTKAAWKVGWAGQLWQDRFHDHIVRKSEECERVANYILENPVRKGLVGRAELYSWSGLPDPM